MLPRFVARLVELDVQERTPFRTLRFFQQLKPGFRRSSIALLAVTRHAGTDDVFPARFTATIPGNHVVKIQILAIEFLRAILAGVVIPLEDVVAGKLHFLLRHAIKEHQQNDFWDPYADRDGVNHVLALVAVREIVPLIKVHRLKRAFFRLDDLRVALVEQHERAFNAADVDSLPETIQNQDILAEDRFHISLGGFRVLRHE